ncbi:MAG: hypothetical protein ACRDRG_19365 [Pseudonocardiaceae bacterium]
MSHAEICEQYAELLPARTVLSLLPTDMTGAGGEPGTAGANGASVGKGFMGIIGWGGASSGPEGSSTPGSDG